jgi:hypothetical protein
MTTFVFVRRFLADYTRYPVNLLLLAVVPAALPPVPSWRCSPAPPRSLRSRCGPASTRRSA